jgi:hypothetical protein
MVMIFLVFVMQDTLGHYFALRITMIPIFFDLGKSRKSKTYRFEISDDTKWVKFSVKILELLAPKIGAREV